MDQPKSSCEESECETAAGSCPPTESAAPLEDESESETPSETSGAPVFCALCNCGDRSLHGQRELRRFSLSPAGSLPEKNTPAATATPAHADDDLSSVGFLPPQTSQCDETGLCWVHHWCAVWSEGVTHTGEGELEGVDEAVISGMKQKCEYCKKLGATIRCRAEGCSNFYHFPCSAASGSFQSLKQLALLCPEHIDQAVEMAGEEARCAVCETAGALADLLACSGCGQHYHTTCLEIKATPSLRCRVCQDCGTRGWTLPGNAQSSESYILCDSCRSQNGSACPVCAGPVPPAAHLSCIRCFRWVHSQCATSADSAQGDYTCYLCQEPPPGGAVGASAGPGPRAGAEAVSFCICCNTIIVNSIYIPKTSSNHSYTPKITFNPSHTDRITSNPSYTNKITSNNRCTPKITSKLSRNTSSSYSYNHRYSLNASSNHSHSPKASSIHSYTSQISSNSSSIYNRHTISSHNYNPNDDANRPSVSSDFSYTTSTDSNCSYNLNTLSSHTFNLNTTTSSTPNTNDHLPSYTPIPASTATAMAAAPSTLGPIAVVEAPGTVPGTDHPELEADAEVTETLGGVEAVVSGEVAGRCSLPEKISGEEKADGRGGGQHISSQPSVHIEGEEPGTLSQMSKTQIPHAGAMKTPTSQWGEGEAESHVGDGGAELFLDEMSNQSQEEGSSDFLGSPREQDTQSVSMEMSLDSQSVSTEVSLDSRSVSMEMSLDSRTVSMETSLAPGDTSHSNSLLIETNDFPPFDPSKSDRDKVKRRGSPSCSRIKQGRSSSFPGKRRPRGGGNGRGRGRSRLKAMESYVGAYSENVDMNPGLNDDDDEDNSVQNTIVLFSCSDKFVLMQDMCTVCGSFGQGVEGQLLVCAQCAQCYHPYCVNSKVSYTLCGPCASLVTCPVCRQDFAEEDLLMQCQHCDRWVHAVCECLYTEDEAEQASDEGFTCTACLPYVSKPIVVMPPSYLAPIKVKEPEPQFYRLEGVWLTEAGMALLRSISLPQLQKKRPRRPLLDMAEGAEPKESQGEGCGEPMECDPKMEGPGSPEGERGPEVGTLGGADGESAKPGEAEDEADDKKKKRKPYRPGIGGFMVRQRKCNLLLKRGRILPPTAGEGVAEGVGHPDPLAASPLTQSQPEPEHAKKRRGKKKSKLEDMLPAYLQEAFFGRALLDLSKRAVQAPAGQRPTAGQARPPHPSAPAAQDPGCVHPQTAEVRDRSTGLAPPLKQEAESDLHSQEGRTGPPLGVDSQASGAAAGVSEATSLGGTPQANARPVLASGLFSPDHEDETFWDPPSTPSTPPTSTEPEGDGLTYNQQWSRRCKQIMKIWRKASAVEKAPFLQKAKDNRAAQRICRAQKVEESQPCRPVNVKAEGTVGSPTAQHLQSPPPTPSQPSPAESSAPPASRESPSTPLPEGLLKPRGDPSIKLPPRSPRLDAHPSSPHTHLPRSPIQASFSGHTPARSPLGHPISPGHPEAHLGPHVTRQRDPSPSPLSGNGVFKAPATPRTHQSDTLSPAHRQSPSAFSPDFSAQPPLTPRPLPSSCSPLPQQELCSSVPRSPQSLAHVQSPRTPGPPSSPAFSVHSPSAQGFQPPDPCSRPSSLPQPRDPPASPQKPCHPSSANPKSSPLESKQALHPHPPPPLGDPLTGNYPRLPAFSCNTGVSAFPGNQPQLCSQAPTQLQPQPLQPQVKAQLHPQAPQPQLQTPQPQLQPQPPQPQFHPQPPQTQLQPQPQPQPLQPQAQSSFGTQLAPAAHSACPTWPQGPPQGPAQPSQQEQPESVLSSLSPADLEKLKQKQRLRELLIRQQMQKNSLRQEKEAAGGANWPRGETAPYLSDKTSRPPPPYPQDRGAGGPIAATSVDDKLSRPPPPWTPFNMDPSVMRPHNPQGFHSQSPFLAPVSGQSVGLQRAPPPVVPGRGTPYPGAPATKPVNIQEMQRMPTPHMQVPGPRQAAGQSPRAPGLPPQFIELRHNAQKTFSGPQPHPHPYITQQQGTLLVQPTRLPQQNPQTEATGREQGALAVPPASRSCRLDLPEPDAVDPYAPKVLGTVGGEEGAEMEDDLVTLHLGPDKGDDELGNLDSLETADPHLDDLLKCDEFDLLAYTDPELDQGDPKDAFSDQLRLVEAEGEGPCSSSTASDIKLEAKPGLGFPDQGPHHASLVTNQKPVTSIASASPLASLQPGLVLEDDQQLGSIKPEEGATKLPGSQTPCGLLEGVLESKPTPVIVKDEVAEAVSMLLGEPATVAKSPNSLSTQPPHSGPLSGLGYPLPGQTDPLMFPQASGQHPPAADLGREQGSLEASELPLLIQDLLEHEKKELQEQQQQKHQVPFQQGALGAQYHGLSTQGHPQHQHLPQGLMGQQGQAGGPVALQQGMMGAGQSGGHHLMSNPQQTAPRQQLPANNLFPNTDLDNFGADDIMDPIAKAKMVALKGIRRVVEQGPHGVPLSINRQQVSQFPQRLGGTPGSSDSQGHMPSGLVKEGETSSMALSRPNPPQFAQGSINPGQQQQYEEWLLHTQQLLQLQLKYLEEQIGAHRKSRKALCAKQRTAKKAGRTFAEADVEKLKLVTEQQSKIQKQLDQVRKQQKEHTSLMSEYRTKQQQRQQSAGLLTPGASMQGPASISGVPRPTMMPQTGVPLLGQQPVRMPGQGQPFPAGAPPPHPSPSGGHFPQGPGAQDPRFLQQQQLQMQQRMQLVQNAQQGLIRQPIVAQQPPPQQQSFMGNPFMPQQQQGMMSNHPVVQQQPPQQQGMVGNHPVVQQQPLQQQGMVGYQGAVQTPQGLSENQTPLQQNPVGQQLMTSTQSMLAGQRGKNQQIVRQQYPRPQAPLPAQAGPPHQQMMLLQPRQEILNQSSQQFNPAPLPQGSAENTQGDSQIQGVPQIKVGLESLQQGPQAAGGLQHVAAPGSQGAVVMSQQHQPHVLTAQQQLPKSPAVGGQGNQCSQQLGSVLLQGQATLGGETQPRVMVKQEVQQGCFMEQQKEAALAGNMQGVVLQNHPGQPQESGTAYPSQQQPQQQQLGLLVQQQRQGMMGQRPGTPVRHIQVPVNLQAFINQNPQLRHQSPSQQIQHIQAMVAQREQLQRQALGSALNQKQGQTQGNLGAAQKMQDFGAKTAGHQVAPGPSSQQQGIMGQSFGGGPHMQQGVTSAQQQQQLNMMGQHQLSQPQLVQARGHAACMTPQQSTAQTLCPNSLADPSSSHPKQLQKQCLLPVQPMNMQNPLPVQGSTHQQPPFRPELPTNAPTASGLHQPSPLPANSEASPSNPGTFAPPARNMGLSVPSVHDINPTSELPSNLGTRTVVSSQRDNSQRPDQPQFCSLGRDTASRGAHTHAAPLPQLLEKPWQQTPVERGPEPGSGTVQHGIKQESLESRCGGAIWSHRQAGTIKQEASSEPISRQPPGSSDVAVCPASPAGGPQAHRAETGQLLLQKLLHARNPQGAASQRPTSSVHNEINGHIDSKLAMLEQKLQGTSGNMEELQAVTKKIPAAKAKGNINWRKKAKKEEAGNHVEALMKQIKQELSLLPLMEPHITANLEAFVPFGSSPANGKAQLKGSFGSAVLEDIPDYYSQVLSKNHLNKPPTPPSSLPPTPPPSDHYKLPNGITAAEEELPRVPKEAEEKDLTAEEAKNADLLAALPTPPHNQNEDATPSTAPGPPPAHAEKVVSGPSHQEGSRRDEVSVTFTLTTAAAKNLNSVMATVTRLLGVETPQSYNVTSNQSPETGACTEPNGAPSGQTPAVRVKEDPTEMDIEEDKTGSSQPKQSDILSIIERELSEPQENPVQHRYMNNDLDLDVRCLPIIPVEESPPESPSPPPPHEPSPPPPLPLSPSQTHVEPTSLPPLASTSPSVKAEPNPAHGDSTKPSGQSLFEEQPPQTKKWKGVRWKRLQSVVNLSESSAPPLQNVGSGGSEVSEPLKGLSIALRLDRLPQDLRSCCFCHEEGDGATDGPARLLNLDVDLWVHLNCALWSTEVYETQGGALINVEAALRRSLRTRCTACKKPGATGGCARPRCPAAFHFACAIRAQCVFFKDKTMLCPLHRPKAAVEGELGSFSVFRRVYVERDELKQVAGVLRRGDRLHTFRVGGLIFHAPGQLLPSQMAAFHSPTAIFPVGYEATRFYWSMHAPSRRCRYRCRITEAEGRPLFQVCVLEQGQEDLLLQDSTPEAEEMFGLTVNTVLRITESLPGVENCQNYTFRYGRHPLIDLPLMINPTGCARSEPKILTHYKSTSMAKTYQPTSPGEIPTPYSKQFIHSKSSQYRRLRTEWKNNVYLARSRIQGLGLYAARDLEMHTMVIEYIGTTIRNEVANRREKVYEEQNRGIYMFRLNNEHVIDATLTGGLARYVNHSCAPNCVTEVVTCDKEDKIIIISSRRIHKGEELTYDYQFDFEDDQHKIPCLCGAWNCRKWMN
ncbi:hypothetical protein JZ751_018184 [Albula glossodonta]|uniref:[histone H3]-lysine(4) N-methyltransferase n=1 Tax=Albula glossodonta TaxID=121402 RepID=A0A8T2PQ67_9TELE|nr:hypothetical protein JZ751_018184 [Albula glossodonta]